MASDETAATADHGHRIYYRWCARCRKALRRYARTQTPWWGV